MLHRVLSAFLAIAAFPQAGAQAQRMLQPTAGDFFRRPAVVKELKLQPDQSKRAAALVESQRRQMRAAVDEIGRRTPRRPEDLVAIRDKLKEFEQAYAKDLAAILV